MNARGAWDEVDSGESDGVSLDGVKWAIAYRWPGPLHEGNGSVMPYFDSATTPEQVQALGKILHWESRRRLVSR